MRSRMRSVSAAHLPLPKSVCFGICLLARVCRMGLVWLGLGKPSFDSSSVDYIIIFVLGITYRWFLSIYLKRFHIQYCLSSHPVNLDNFFFYNKMQEFRQKSNDMLGDRVQILSDKINNMKFGSEGTSNKRLDSLEWSLEQLECQFQLGKGRFQKQSFEVKHLLSRIQKEVTYDYQGTDKMVKEEIRRCEERYSQLTEINQDERRVGDAKIMKFINDKSVALRELIDQEAKERQARAQEIECSLNGDLNEIKDKVQEQKRINQQTLEEIQDTFVEDLARLKQDFNDQCETQAESEAQFYKMLRDLLKKVKGQITDDKAKRENMQESLLALIEKMCDKAIQQVSSQN